MRQATAIGLALAVVMGAGQAVQAALPDDASSAYEDALASFNDDDYNTAIIHLKNALKLDPRNLSARVLLGRTYLAMGAGQLAENEFKKARQQGAGDDFILVPLARSYLMQGEHEKLFREVQPGGRSPKLEAEIQVVRGDAHLDLQEYDFAREAYGAASRIQPQSAEPLLGQARVDLAEGDNEKALAWVDQAKTLEPRNGDVWFLRGESLQALGRLDEAVQDYDLALEIDPKHEVARLSRANALLDLGRYEPAVEDLEAVLERSPLNARAAYLKALALAKLGKKEEAEKALDDAGVVLNSLDPDFAARTPSVLMLRGVVAYLRHDNEGAYRNLDAFIARVPHHLAARKLLGQIMIDRGEASNAIDLLEPALDRQPGDAELLTLLGNAYMNARLYDRAIETFQKAAAVLPDAPNIRTNLARVRLTVGDTNMAISDLEKALEISPESKNAAALLGIARLGESRYQEALDAAKRLIEQDPENAFALNLAGGAYVGLGEHEEARKSFEAAIAADPYYDSPKFNLAKLDLSLGNRAAARDRYVRMANRDRPNIEAMVELARLEENARNLKEAIAWLERASYADRQNLPPQVHLVDLYLATGDTLKALDLAQRLKDLAPTDLPVRLAEAKAELANGHTDMAVQIYRRMGQISRDRRSVEWLNRTADRQMAIQDFAGAEETLSSGLNYFPDSVQLQAAMVRLDSLRGDSDEALTRAENLRRSNPDSPVGDLLAGDLLRKAGRSDAAVSAFREAFEKAPTSSAMLRLYHARVDAGDRSAALTDLEDWVKDHPEDLAASRTLAAGYIEAGRLDTAIAAHEKLLEQLPNDAALLNNLANLYLHTANPRAQETAQKAYDLAPNQPATMDTLGWVLVQQGDPVRGLSLLREAEVRAPGQPQVAYHLAVALSKVGQVDEARRKLQQLLAVNTEFENADEARALLSELGGS